MLMSVSLALTCRRRFRLPSTWLLLSPEERFEFCIFVRSMVGEKGWEKLFSSKATSEDILNG
jgi:hypothetical protein